MYESPIQLYKTDITTQLIKKQEEQILKAVQGVAVGIDHEELFRALRYDRDQYKKGYQDACCDRNLVEVVRCKDCINYNPKGCADGFGWCEAWDQGRMNHHFCHCGERKDNG